MSAKDETKKITPEEIAKFLGASKVVKVGIKGSSPADMLTKMQIVTEMSRETSEKKDEEKKT